MREASPRRATRYREGRYASPPPPLLGGCSFCEPLAAGPGPTSASRPVRMRTPDGPGQRTTLAPKPAPSTRVRSRPRTRVAPKLGALAGESGWSSTERDLLIRLRLPAPRQRGPVPKHGAAVRWTAHSGRATPRRRLRSKRFGSPPLVGSSDPTAGVASSSGGTRAGNQANLMVGSRVQQTCTAHTEQAVEVVRNGTGGTRPWLGMPGPKVLWEVTWRWWKAVLRDGWTRSPLAASAATPFRWEVTEHWEWTWAAEVDGEAIFETIHERSPARLRADLPREAQPRRWQTQRSSWQGHGRRRRRGSRGADDDLPGGTQDAAASAAADSGPPTGAARAQAASATLQACTPSAGTPRAGPRVGLVTTSVVTDTWSPAAPPGARPARGSRWRPGPCHMVALLLGARGRQGPTPRTALGLTAAKVKTESQRTAKARRVRLRRDHHPGRAGRQSP